MTNNHTTQSHPIPSITKSAQHTAQSLHHPINNDKRTTHQTPAIPPHPSKHSSHINTTYPDAFPQDDVALLRGRHHRRIVLQQLQGEAEAADFGVWCLVCCDVSCGML